MRLLLVLLLGCSSQTLSTQSAVIDASEIGGDDASEIDAAGVDGVVVDAARDAVRDARADAAPQCIGVGGTCNGASLSQSNCCRGLCLDPEGDQAYRCHDCGTDGLSCCPPQQLIEDHFCGYASDGGNLWAQRHECNPIGETCYRCGKNGQPCCVNRTCEQGLSCTTAFDGGSRSTCEP